MHSYRVCKLPRVQRNNSSRSSQQSLPEPTGPCGFFEPTGFWKGLSVALDPTSVASCSPPCSLGQFLQAQPGRSWSPLLWYCDRVGAHTGDTPQVRMVTLCGNILEPQHTQVKAAPALVHRGVLTHTAATARLP